MLTEIFKVIPFYFSYVYAFFFFFKISKALYSKAIPVSLFMHYPADSKCLWRRMSRTESSSSQTQPFLLPLERRREEKADRNKGDKREAREMKGSKESCPGSSSIHLVSDICFFIAT